MIMKVDNSPTIYTVGHSNHKIDSFLELLRQHDIQVLIDVRSSPYSRYVPQANRETLARALQSFGVEYRWRGQNLGGKPQGATGDYDEIHKSQDFQEGLAELITLARDRKVTIMCSEGDHRKCHRHKLITPALLEQSARVIHILPDGSLLDEGEQIRQLALF
jgi:uncharacterized protein (DUF488 family)